jgi:DNA-binding Xre family transcriptional regulator
MIVEWNIKQLLEKHGKTPYALMKETGLSRQTIYSIANNQTSGLDFRTMAKIVEGLAKLTGQSITPNDVLKFAPAENDPIREEAALMAGYAVGAIVHGIPFKRVQISHGEQEAEFDYEPTDNAKAEALLEFVGVSAKEAHGDPHEERDSQDAQTMYELVTSYLEERGIEVHEDADEARGELKDIFDELQSEANDVLKTHWRRVEAISKTLLEQFVLTSDEAKAIFWDA